jgi:hypothetical protein
MVVVALVVVGAVVPEALVGTEPDEDVPLEPHAAMASASATVSVAIGVFRRM